jgi:hypothetical protein
MSNELMSKTDRRPSIARAILAGALSALLTCCSSMPLPSLIQLSRISVETTDLAKLRVAVQLPNALKPRAGGVNMDVVVKVSGDVDQTTTFHLAEVRDPVELSALPGPARAGFSSYLFRLAPSDVDRFAALRAAVVGKRRDGRRGSVGIGIAAKEFCAVGPLSSGALLTTTYLSTSETNGYVVVSADFDLAQDKTIAQQLLRLGAC